MASSTQDRLRTYLYDILLLLALCLIFFWRALTPSLADRLSFVPGDFYDQFVAFARYEATRLHAGQLPLWNPYTFAGHPFLADVQAAIFYPLSLLTMLATSGLSALPSRALELEALLHFPLAALFTYLLARRLTNSRSGGLVAAGVYTFSGYLTSYPPLQLAILEVQAWLPLILLTLDLAASAVATGASRRALGWTLAAGLALGLSTLAGHPQSSLLVLYGTVCFALFRLFVPKLAGLHAVSPWRRLGLIGLFVAVGLGIAAAQLLPSLEFMRLSTRSAGSFDEMGIGFTPYDLIQVVLPAVGVPFPALYVGILPLGLAAAAIVRYLSAAYPDTRPARQRLATLQVAFWTALGGLALLLSFGKHLPVYQVFYLLAPGWRLFRHQERAIVWAVLAVALLAGFGAAWLVRLRKNTGRQATQLQLEGEARLQRVLVQVLSAAALVALAAALLYLIVYQAGSEQIWGFTTATLFLAAMLALSALAVRSGRASVVLAVIVLDLFTVTPGNHRGPLVADPFPPLALLQIPLADPEPFRMANQGVLPANYGVAYGLEEIDGASPLRLARWQTAVERLPQERLWALLNVRYVLSRSDTLETPVERVADGAGLDGQPAYLHRLAQPSARAWLAGEVLVEPDDDQLWQRLAGDSFDPARQVLLPALPAGWSGPAAASDGGGSVVWLERLPERLALEVASPQPAILVLSELSYPGWRVTVDGAAAPLLEANGLLRAVALEAGTHQVELAYQPASVSAGLALSVATLLAVVVGLGLLALAARRQKPDS
jgi:hypothetical protein